MKNRNFFICQECAAEFTKWSGQCSSCGAWNSLMETSASIQESGRKNNFLEPSVLTQLADISLQTITRMSTGLIEVDRVLGGGLVPGMVVLIGGDPGIGKSTLLAQVLSHLSKSYTTLYITGEESLQQVSLRSQRLALDSKDMYVLAETCVEPMLIQAQRVKPKIVVIDSIQTLYTQQLTSSAGSVSQVRESAALWIQYAKQEQIALFIVGHVTKEGILAGPRVLEHMVDTVLYFEGEKNSRFRLLRTVKNRFGAVNELGIFAMSEKGLQIVSNPSAIFLSKFDSSVSGTAITATWEGTRPLLVEVQALSDKSYLQNPKRVTVGIEQNRLSLLLAVLHRFIKIHSHDKDIYINVVGGMKITETAADLALLLALYSSLTGLVPKERCLIFGEIGLTGEIRPIQYGLERLKEAEKLGFHFAIVPEKNAPAKPLTKIEVKSVKHIQEAIEVMHKFSKKSAS